jgi:hypothetical protein
MGDISWIPDTIPLDKPSAARIYDYFLGGYHNFEIDRQMGDMLVTIYPNARVAAHACRAFLRRAVRFLVAQGIEQFLDIGSGIPTVGNVHEVAQGDNPNARIVYVDVDPVAVAHSRAMLQNSLRCTAIQGDFCQPQEILSHPDLQRLLDLEQPVALLLLTMLHHIVDDERLFAAMRVFRESLAPGSYVAISHGTSEKSPDGVKEKVESLSSRITTPNRYRSREEIGQLFEGFDLLEPGLVSMPLWRPESADDPLFDQPDTALMLAGVGRKR